MTSSSSPPELTEFSTEISNAARRAIFWTIGAFFLALTVRDNGGRHSPAGMVCLTLAIFYVAGALGTPQWVLRWNAALQADPQRARRALNMVLALAATLFAAFWIMPDKMAPRLLVYALTWSACALFALILARLSRLPLLRKALFPVFMALIFFAGASKIIQAKAFEATPALRFHVSNDVQIFNEEAARLMLHGQNPYSTHMPNVMGRDYPFYPPHVSVNGRLPFGYPYPPLSVFWLLTGYLIGDTRFMHLVALVGAALLLAYARPSSTSQLAATVFALFPSTLFVLVMSWTEPLAVLCLAATLFCFFRAPKWLFVALGCLICSKQYTFFLLPLLPLLVPDKTKMWPLIWKSVAVACVISLPLALWDLDGFQRSVIEMQFKQPFRADSLSYLASLVKLGGPQLSPLFGFLALFGGLWLGLKTLPRVAASWPGAGALAFLIFFAFNKQAFANYYFWTFSLLLSAVAVALPELPDHDEEKR